MNLTSTPSARPLVTVYITNHNYERYIEQSIESVLAQTLQDFEVIIIDDGSTDNSREVIERYADHPRFSIIYQKNKGLNVTNNIALRSAAGKYIMRLDADDFLDPHALELMSSRLEQDSTLGLIFPDYYLTDADGNVECIEKRHSFDEEVSMLDQPAHGACTMIRHSALLAVGGYDEQYRCQDGYELWIKFTAKFPVKNINLPLFYYRKHNANLTGNEERLLNTRSAIKQAHFDRQQVAMRTVAFLPVRGRPVNHQSFALEELGGRPVIDWIIPQALAARHVDCLVLSTPDEQLLEYAKATYANEPNLQLHYRDPSKARLNVDLVGTVSELLDHEAVKQLNPEALVELSIANPFIRTEMIDDLVHTCHIFDCDSVISVRPDTNKFFKHDGNGLKPAFPQESFTRLERDALMRRAGGLSLTRADYFREHRKLVGGRVGHIVLDAKAAHGITDQHEFELARFLATQSSEPSS